MSETLPAASADPYMTPTEVSRLLQVSETTVYRWAAEDPTMPTLRLGRTVRFPRARFLAWLRSREQGLGQRPRRVATPVQPRAPVGRLSAMGPVVGQDPGAARTDGDQRHAAGDDR